MTNNKKTVSVALLQRIFPHYRAPIFRSLGERMHTRIFHGKNHSGIPQLINQYSEECELQVFFGLSYLPITIRLMKFNPAVYIHEFSLSLLNLYTVYIISRLTGKKFVLWGHGYDRAKGFDPDKRISDKIRQYFISKSDAVILYSDKVALELSQRYPSQQFFVARNSIDSDTKRSVYAQLSRIGRKGIKDETNFPNGLNVCFVSRLTKNKKIHLLTDFVKILKAKGVHCTVHIVGDGPELPALKNIVSALQQTDCFRFHGSIYEEELVARILHASDFMIMPAWLGLSINHSLCYGTPVATLSTELHPPEFEFAEDGINAVVAKSIDELADRVLDIWSNDESYQTMRLNARHYYESKLSLINMQAAFSSAIEFVSRKDNLTGR